MNTLGISRGSHRIFTLHVICDSELPVNKKNPHTKQIPVIMCWKDVHT